VDAPDTAAEVRRFLDGERTMTLAFADTAGPWAADVYYVRRGAEFFVLSSPSSRHARAFSTGAAAAATVRADSRDWREIRGVQMSGRAGEVAAGPERETALGLYTGRFPFATEILLGAARRLDRVRVYRFAAERVLWIDNRTGLGNRREVLLTPGSDPAGPARG
jgi:uncharacterized protein YhbP (UPF0306 family)